MVRETIAKHIEAGKLTIHHPKGILGSLSDDEYNLLIEKSREPKPPVLGDSGKWTATIRVDDFPEDDDTRIQQVGIINGHNPTIHFGPLSTTLQEMFDKGYWLQTIAFRKDKARCTERKCRIYLMDRTNRYKIGSISWGELQKQNRQTRYNLSECLTEGRNLIATHSPSRYYVQKERDPWEQIMEKYPTPRREIMIGNHTLEEHLREKLDAVA